MTEPKYVNPLARIPPTALQPSWYHIHELWYAGEASLKEIAKLYQVPENYIVYVISRYDGYGKLHDPPMSPIQPLTSKRNPNATPITGINKPSTITGINKPSTDRHQNRNKRKQRRNRTA